MSIGGFIVPVYGTGVIVACLDRGADMCVDPERPQGVVQVESDQFWEWEAVGECFGGHGGILQRLSVLALGSKHVWYEEHAKNQKNFGRTLESKKEMDRGSDGG